MPDIHVVDRYFEAVKQLGIVNDRSACSLFLDPLAEVDLVAFELTSKQYIAVAMGAQFATKQIPVSLLAKSLSVSTLPIVLLGGKEDEERAELLKNKLNSKKTIDFCGKLSLMQSSFITKHAKVLLTSDTGLMHIASSFNTPIILSCILFTK